MTSKTTCEPVRKMQNQSFSQKTDPCEPVRNTKIDTSVGANQFANAKNSDFESFQSNQDDISLDPYALYIKDVRNSADVATRDMNDELLRRYADGEDVIDEIILANQPLVVSIAKKYVNRTRYMDFEDLISYGTLGLYRAVKKFDVSKGFAFSTYAYYWIKQSIIRELSNLDASCHIPVHVSELLRVYNVFVTKYEDEHSEKPAKETVLQELDLTESQYMAIMRSINILSVQSLNDKVLRHQDSDREDSELGDLLPDNGPSVEECALQEEVSKVVMDAIERFVNRKNSTEKTRDVTREMIYRRFGVGNADHQEQFQDIANDYGVSKQLVEQRTSAFLRFAREDTKLQNYFREEIAR